VTATVPMAGRTFDRLFILERVQTDRPTGAARWRAQCECKTVLVVCGKDVRRGRTKSCGCLRIEVATALLARLNAVGPVTCRWCQVELTPENASPILFARTDGPDSENMQCHDDRACTKRQKKQRNQPCLTP
jgi:hypothetical protein